MDFLKRELAPITDTAWAMLDQTAAALLKKALVARRLVDFDGPRGWDFAGVPTGRMELGADRIGDIGWGLRQVQPLMELRLAFKLDTWELDNLTRGARDVELKTLEQAVRDVAAFENHALLNGFAPASMRGLAEAKGGPAVALPAELREWPEALANILLHLEQTGIAGPYALVLPPAQYTRLWQPLPGGGNVRKVLGDLLGGEIAACEAAVGGLLLSTRGGDFQMTVGQDLSLGYLGHDSRQVELFLTESFTFRVLEPRAVVGLRF